MGEGAGNPPRPGAPLPSASLRAQLPESRCPLAACRSRGFCLRPSCHPAASPPGEGSTTETEGRGKGRDEAQGGAAEARGKAGCVYRGRVGWGRLCQFNPEGVSFIYLFKKICHESHYTDLPEERRKRVGSEGRRLREVNLKIPLIEGL